MKKVDKSRMKKGIGILLTLSILLTSCLNLRPISSNEKRIQTITTKQLDGVFQNIAIDSSFRSLEWVFMQSDDLTRSDFAELKIELKSIDENQLEVKSIGDNKIIKTKIINGEFKNGYFVLKRRMKFDPKYILLNGYVESKTRIGLLNNGNLTVDTENGACALLVVIPVFCTDTEHYGLEFYKVN